jgi:hypothetical protein
MQALVSVCPHIQEVLGTADRLRFFDTTRTAKETQVQVILRLTVSRPVRLGVISFFVACDRMLHLFKLQLLFYIFM